MASVRGMGVADIISWWTSRPLFLRARRWATPKRCCSSTITKPRFWNSTSSENRACVPTAILTVPSASLALASSLAFLRWLPESQTTSRPKGSSHCLNLMKCCSARISVGAITAACAPDSMAVSADKAATMVLPLPTSPCSRRCMGWVCAMSRRISDTTLSWASVRANGKAWRRAWVNVPSPPNAAAVPLTRFCRASRMESCCAKSSSNLSRCHAGSVPSESWWMVKLGGGECKRRRLSARCGSFRRPNKASGSVSCSGVTFNAV